jgi:hypothetical protein
MTSPLKSPQGLLLHMPLLTTHQGKCESRLLTSEYYLVDPIVAKASKALASSVIRRVDA